MHYEHNFEIAQNFAKDAFARLQKDSLAPDPHNYELWYAYYSLSHPELRKAMDALIKKKGNLNHMDCRNFYDQFLSDSGKQKVFKRASDQIHATLEDVSSLIKNVKDVSNDYTETLSNVTERIAAVETPAEIQDILASVMTETARMMQHNRTLEEKIDQSAVAMEELRKDMDRVRQEAMTDGLTGLANRKSFDENLERLSQEAKESGHSFTLLLVDIDHFKSFNDNFGHQVGDQVLRLVARTLTDGIKGRDIACRYGGEEFTILLPETNIEAGIAVAESLRKALAGKEIINRANGELLGRITMSVGVAQNYEGEKTDELIERADAALYKAKNNGRNLVMAATTPHERSMNNKI